jgi:hypothetical protein
LSISTWVIAVGTSTLFSILNALKSAKKIPGDVAYMIGEACSTVGNFFQTVITCNWQFKDIFRALNPFNIAAKIIKAAVFLGHLIVVGFIADRVPWLNPYASGAANAAMEGMNDWHYVRDEHSKQEEHHHSHDHGHSHGHGGHAHADGHQHEEHQHHDHQQHNHSHDEDDHHHHHGDFVTSKVHTLLNSLGTVWDWVCSGFASWQASKENFFPTKNLAKAPEKLSEEWTRFEINAELAAHSQHYTERGLTVKAQAFSQLKQALAAQPEEKAKSNLYQILDNTLFKAIQPGQELWKHRHCQFFSSKSPASVEYVREMRNDRSYGLR